MKLKRFSETREFSLVDRLKYMKKSPAVRLRAIITEYRRALSAAQDEDKAYLIKLLTHDLQAELFEFGQLLADNRLDKLLNLSSIDSDLAQLASKLTIDYRKALTNNPKYINKFVDTYTEFISSLVELISK